MKGILETGVKCAATATLASLVFFGCGSDSGSGSGSLSVLLEGEEASVVKLITDGWSAEYDKHIIVVGGIELWYSSDRSLEERAGDVFVVDLSRIPQAGLPLWELENLKSGRWEFHYSTPVASIGSVRHDSVSESDYQSMISNGWTYYVEGAISKSDGQSCPPSALVSAGEKEPNGKKSGENDCYDARSVRFEFGAPVATAYGPCEVDGVSGVAIASGGVKTVSVTIHGDHLFFNGFPEGEESSAHRLAQWIADCDLDLDGVVTEEELKAVAPFRLPEIDERYQLGGSPITPLSSMYEYVIGQFMQQGHFQGEGECPIGSL